MKEIISIVDTYKTLLAKGEKGVVATVVSVRGSAYRRPGARMLISESGHWIGSVSGGCLESSTMQHAREVIKSGEPRLVKFDTRLNSKDAIGMGYGCNGLLEVLIEPLNGAKVPVFEWLEKLPSRNSVGGMATVFKSGEGSVVGPGSGILLSEDGLFNNGVSDKALEDVLKKDLLSVMEDGIGRSKPYTWKGEKIEVLFEVYPPATTLLIFGAVFHAVPIKKMATDLGWDVVIVDDLSGNPTPPDFPGAESVAPQPDGQVHALLRFPSRVAILFLTHNFMYIIDKLGEVLPLAPPYVGILGSRKKTEKILATLEERGYRLTARDRKVLHFPVGLDIGGDRPESIALSILAEIHAVMHGRTGGFLSRRSEAIHERASGSRGNL